MSEAWTGHIYTIKTTHLLKKFQYFENFSREKYSPKNL